MKAYVTSQLGSPEGSRLAEIETPQITDFQLLIKVHSVSINPIDWKTRKGLGWAADAIKNKLPGVLGFDFSGEIYQVGKLLSQQWTIGEKVCGFQSMITNGGTFTEFLKTTPNNIARMPMGVSFDHAAALPCSGLTAWQSVNKLNIKANEKVLIIGGAGGVGHLALQLAKQFSGQIYATSSIEKHPKLSQLGATTIDYKNTKEIERKQGFFDVIVDCVGGDTGIKGLNLLKKGGRLITLPTNSLIQIQAEAKRSYIQAEGLIISMDRMQLENILSLVKQKQIKVLIDSQYSFSDIHHAFKQSETGRSLGKVIVKIVE